MSTVTETTTAIMQQAQQLIDMQQARQLIEQVRAVGTPDAMARTDALQTGHHDTQMARLGTDVYDSAAGEGQPPPGWTRVSDDPQRMADVAVALGVSQKELSDMLKPRDSGFRAEIYLPDPAVVGPGFKPAIAFKGSSGEVLQADGTRRDTTIEDFGANNFPQSIGQETDYYTRAMRLALAVRRSGFDCEGAGHSLGGGLSSAFSAISGRPSTTFNAAGLHPETAARFARQNPGVEVHDVSRSIRAYEVSGEVLNDGIQDNIRSLSDARRERVGEILQSVSTLMRNVPDAQRLMEWQFEKADMPDHARDAVRGFFNAVATQDVDALLRAMPEAAGMRQPPLQAMTNRDGAVVDRDAMLGLPRITRLADPLLKVAEAAGHSAELGQRVGSTEQRMVNAAGAAATHVAGRIAEVNVATAEAVSDVTRATGQAVAAGVEVAARAAATGRRHAGELEARVDHLQGEVQARPVEIGAEALRTLTDHLPGPLQRAVREAADQLQRTADHARRTQQDDARAARADAQSDAAQIRQQGRGVERQVAIHSHDLAEAQRQILPVPGKAVAAATATAAKVGDAVAEVLPAKRAASYGAGGVAVGFGLLRPNESGQAGFAAGAGGFEVLESFDRHLMVKTVLPSMDARVGTLQAEARTWLQQQSHGATHTAPSAPPAAAPTSPATDPRQPTHPDHRAYQQIHAAVAGTGLWNQEQATNVAATLLAKFKIEAPGQSLGMAVAGRSADNGDVSVFAVGASSMPGGGQRVVVSGMEAAVQPAQLSFERVEQINQQQMQAQQHAQQLAQEQPARRGPSMG